MVYADPVNNFMPDPHINLNLLDQFNSSATIPFLGRSTPIGVGFAGTFTSPIGNLNPSIDSIDINTTFYSRLSVGNSMQDALGITGIDDFFWYNGSGIVPPSTNLTEPEFLARGSKIYGRRSPSLVRLRECC